MACVYDVLINILMCYGNNKITLSYFTHLFLYDCLHIIYDELIVEDGIKAEVEECSTCFFQSL